MTQLLQDVGDDLPGSSPHLPPYSEFLREYKLGRVVGQGSFGVVRKCKHKKTKESFVVKTVPASDKRVWKCEVDVLVRSRVCDHSHIVTCHGAYLDAEREEMHLLFDYCAGGNVHDYLSQVTMDDERVDMAIGHLGLDTNPFCQSAPPGESVERRAGCILAQLLRAIRHCHDVAGVAHGDVKPGNILVRDRPYHDDDHGNQPNIQLVDFGLSCRFDGDSQSALTSARVGTLGYCAPEVLENHKERSAINPCAADMWSVGAVAYSLLYGRPPFEGKDEKETKYLICHGPLVFPDSPTFSENAKEFISMLLNRDPSLRPTAMKALRHKWLHSHLRQDRRLSKSSSTSTFPSSRSFHGLDKKNCSNSVGSTMSTGKLKKSSSSTSVPGLLKSLFARRKPPAGS